MKLRIRYIGLGNEQKAELIKQDRTIFDELTKEFDKKYIDLVVKARAEIHNRECAEVEAGRFYINMYIEKDGKWEWKTYNIAKRIIEKEIKQEGADINPILEEVRILKQKSDEYEKKKREEEEQKKEKERKWEEERERAREMLKDEINRIINERDEYREKVWKLEDENEKLKKIIGKYCEKQTIDINEEEIREKELINKIIDEYYEEEDC